MSTRRKHKPNTVAQAMSHAERAALCLSLLNDEAVVGEGGLTAHASEVLSRLGFRSAPAQPPDAHYADIGSGATLSVRYNAYLHNVLVKLGAEGKQFLADHITSPWEFALVVGIAVGACDSLRSWRCTVLREQWKRKSGAQLSDHDIDRQGGEYGVALKLTRNLALSMQEVCKLYDKLGQFAGWIE